MESEKDYMVSEDENRLVGVLWKFPDKLNDVTVKPDDLSDVRLGRVFKAMVSLHNSGAALEPIEIERTDPKIDPLILRGLLRSTASLRNLPIYEMRIKESAARRRLRTAGMMIKERAETGTSISEDIAFSHKSLESLGECDETEDITAPEMVSQFRAEMIEGKASNRGIYIHLPAVNERTNGFQPGEFVVIGAFTNDGKSALKMNFAVSAAEYGHSVGIISLEDSMQRYRNRMLSYLSGVNSSLIKMMDKNGFSNEQSQNLVRAEEELEKLDIVITHKAGMSIADIVGKARYWKAKYNIEMLIVDYIQIIENPGFTNYRERMMDTVLKLTAMTRNLGIVLVTSSQLNRQGETNPTLSNLAETSKIEHQADYVFLIEAEDVTINSQPARQPTALVMAKGRDVPKNLKVPIRFVPNMMKLKQDTTK